MLLRRKSPQSELMARNLAVSRSCDVCASSMRPTLGQTSFTTRAFGTADSLHLQPFLQLGDSLLGLCPKPQGLLHISVER